MSPRTIAHLTIRTTELIRDDTPVSEAARAVVRSELPALPVVDRNGKLVGIFGEREFITAVFPGYLDELRTAAFVPKSLEETLEKRAGCGAEPVARHMNEEDIAVDVGSADAQVAERFLHHRVLILPVLENGEVIGVITRSDFFRELVKRFDEVT